MIDPTKITNFDLSIPELEEHLMFWVCAAGKNGVTAAKCLNNLLKALKQEHGKVFTPFSLIKLTDPDKLPQKLKTAGIGSYNLKAAAFVQLANSGFDLRKCSVDDLESIKGIGPKTARCFLIHSRPNQKLAGLDVHILRFLKDKGYDVPKTTPTGKKYKKVERWFVQEAEKAGKDVATFDLEIWNEYRTKNAA